jgi:hypothetical protein
VVYAGGASNETVELVRAADTSVENPDQAYQLVVPPGSTAVGPCTHAVDDLYAYCPASVGALPVRLVGSDGDDTLSVQVNPGAIKVAVTLDGGAGNDRLNGAYEPTTLLGGPGDDTLSGDSNRSRGSNADGRGPDVFSGGDGRDEVSYYLHGATSITVTIDGQANDGVPGEGDNVMTDVENLEGLVGGSNDFTGSDGPNELHGSSAGDDVLRGGGGNDRLLGFDRADKLEGGDGDDYLEGGFGDDTLTGGTGLDSFVGDRTERDVIGVGNDTIFARDGVGEPIACGPGSDTAEVDNSDIIAADGDNACESVKVATVAASGFVAISTKAVTLSRTRQAAVRVTCKSALPAGCSGTLKVKRGTKTLGSTSFSIAPGKTAAVRITLSKATVRKLKRSQKVTVTATSRPPGQTGSATLTLRKRR